MTIIVVVTTVIVVWINSILGTIGEFENEVEMIGIYN